MRRLLQHCDLQAWVRSGRQRGWLYMDDVRRRLTHSGLTMDENAIALVKLGLYECYTSYKVFEDVLIFRINQINLKSIKSLL